MFPYAPGGLDYFVEKAASSCSGEVGSEYEGETLRESLGLMRPKNRVLRLKRWIFLIACVGVRRSISLSLVGLLSEVERF